MNCSIHKSWQYQFLLSKVHIQYSGFSILYVAKQDIRQIAIYFYITNNVKYHLRQPFRLHCKTDAFLKSYIDIKKLPISKSFLEFF